MIDSLELDQFILPLGQQQLCEHLDRIHGSKYVNYIEPLIDPVVSLTQCSFDFLKFSAAKNVET